MTYRYGLSFLAAGLLLTGSFSVRADEATTSGATFSSLQAPSLEVAKAQAAGWLKAAGKTDEASQKAFDAIWSSDRSLLERVAETLALGDAGAARLLEEARRTGVPAPKEVPAILKDGQKPVFFRSNLTLAYAKALSNRRIFEESLESLKLVKAEQVVDPAAYLFHKAVAEHALLLKEDARRSLTRLLDDIPDAPARYRQVAELMFLDIQQWKDKDLAEIARKMDNIARRLDLDRTGPTTQKQQKEVIARLDELIKKLENQQKAKQQQAGGQPKPGGGGQQPGGQEPGCPSGGQGDGQQPGGNTNQPSQPMQDSNIATNSGPGKADEKRFKDINENWGKLPEGKRTRAQVELPPVPPAKYRDVSEDYFKKLAGATGKP